MYHCCGLTAAVWSLPYACAQPYHPDSGSCFSLIRSHQHGIAVGPLYELNRVLLDSNGPLRSALSAHRSDGYAMLKNPNKGETAVHGCHRPAWYGYAHAAEFSANIGIVPWLTLFRLRKYYYLWYNSDMAFFNAELTKYWDPVLKELHQMEQSRAIFLKEESRIKRSRGSQILVHVHHRTL